LHGEVEHPSIALLVRFEHRRDPRLVLEAILANGVDVSAGVVEKAGGADGDHA
jgi:hypothetical protein